MDVPRSATVGAPPTGSLPLLGTIGRSWDQRDGALLPRSEVFLPVSYEPLAAAQSTCWSRHLETKGLVRRLAEPNLMALSGDAARFLAGGEFPVPIASTRLTDGFPTITIEYKKFGVELAFVPTVLSRGVINLRVEPSVSELDFANAVTIAGTTVPALTRRDARTTVELRDGQSFAIAGLLQTRNPQDVSQLPWIGSVPVLGALVPQLVVPAAGNRSGDHRDAAPGCAGGAGAAIGVAARFPPAGERRRFLPQRPDGREKALQRLRQFRRRRQRTVRAHHRPRCPPVRTAVVTDQPVVKTLN